MEIKAPELYPGIERQTLRCCAGRAGSTAASESRLIVQSFSADAVRRSTLRPDVKTGFLGTPAVADLPGTRSSPTRSTRATRRSTPTYVKAVQACAVPHGRPLEVYTWTVTTRPTAVKVARMGVDGIITNKPDVVREALADIR